MYIDNCVTSVEDEKELVDFMKYCTEILAETKMDLCIWTYAPALEDVRIIPEDLSMELSLEDPVQF